MTTSSIGSSIREWRERRGTSLSDFADEIGMSKGKVSAMERDLFSPGVKAALKIESLSQGRIDAADLNEDVRAARHGIGNTPLPAPASPDNACEITPQGKAA